MEVSHQKRSRFAKFGNFNFDYKLFQDTNMIYMYVACE